ncbi:MAG: flagellar motor switch protein FliN [Alphaproteobacteria bacterium]|jgi:flagellar motor switch protein FliN/FliY|nr:flagellar motor switch protein FliN [Alphaproteobacteria bacterium]
MSDDGKTGTLETDLLGSQFKKIENVETKLTVEVGSTFITIRDLLKLNVGSVVELDTVAGEHLRIMVNGVPVARGEIVIMGETLGIRFTDVITPEN